MGPRPEYSFDATIDCEIIILDITPYTVYDTNVYIVKIETPLIFLKSHMSLRVGLKKVYLRVGQKRGVRTEFDLMIRD